MKCCSFSDVMEPEIGNRQQATGNSSQKLAQTVSKKYFCQRSIPVQTQNPKLKNSFRFLFKSALISWCLAFSLPVVTLSPRPVMANNIIQVRLGDTSDIPIAQGVTLTFIPSRQIIQKIWLDNPTWITLDTDGCLEGLGTSSCQQPGATSIHLRRIEPLHIEGLLPSSSSRLTVISRDVSGHLKISTFRLVPAETDQYSIVEVVPLERGFVDIVNADFVERGRAIAISQGWMRERDHLYQKIDQFLTLIKTESVSVAAEQSGVSIALVQRLHSLGEESFEF